MRCLCNQSDKYQGIRSLRNSRMLTLLFGSFGWLWLVSCNSPLSLTGARSAHARYIQMITDAGLSGSVAGSQWLRAGQQSLDQPTDIRLPFSEAGFFPADRPAAAGLRFRVSRGERIRIQVTSTPSRGYQLFAELWHLGPGKPELVAAADSSTRTIDYEVADSGRYVFRLQPELLQPVGYRLEITTAPSMAFPVRSQDNPRAQSFWGADRDGGARAHEGVDIFARKGTPAIAISPGTVTRVNENRLGGKVVFVRPRGVNISLYYAHLDSQLVQAGQEVNTGDIIGLIGNTGNARTTPAHLHFGIYASGGALDPWPFINVNRSKPAAISADTSQLNQWVSLTSRFSYTPSDNGINKLALGSGSLVRVLGASGNSYRVEVPPTKDNRAAGVQHAFIPATQLSSAVRSSRKIQSVTPLLSDPSREAAVVRLLQAGESIRIYGHSGEFDRVTVGTETGWVSP